MSVLRNCAFAAVLVIAAQSGAAHASVIYSLTLIPTSGGTVSGSGSFTISTPPLTGINQVSNYSQSAGTLTDLSITFGSDNFTLATKNNGSNPLVQFTSGSLDDITYAGLSANGDGDSLQITSQFVYFIAQGRTQEIGSFSATPSIASAVPEPSTWAMMILGFCGLGFMAYRRRNHAPSMTAA